jgi:hypothetical protein
LGRQSRFLAVGQGATVRRERLTVAEDGYEHSEQPLSTLVKRPI